MWSGKCSVGEMSVWGNVLVGKCPVEEVSFGEVSGRGIVRSGKCPSGKRQSGNCPRGTVQSGNCPHTVFQCYLTVNVLIVSAIILFDCSTVGCNSQSSTCAEKGISFHQIPPKKRKFTRQE